MPVGMQVWDENGSLTVDLTTRLTKILGSSTAAGSSGGTLSDLRLSSGTGFAVPLRGPSNSRTENYPVISVSGSTISWTGGNVAVPFLYGVF